ncbi:hypothetical protein SAMN05444000_10323 [Shimia gijangensis]|uniref:Uncharacterized protein n=1 Tax=Shimia gijangensis TaxID=1470563 RepID=A0A1M6DVY4_9RHOB|nr:hypothetical protein [Shimia gijangensis]SHI77381.1 hypothetical protein SAMN05444000_10323 [Shimia gijangensis]
MKTLISIVAFSALLAAPATAQTWSSNAPKIGPVNQPEGLLIQAYPTSSNHCQAGYQPVVVGGVICCGKPNSAAPAPTQVSYTASCPAGTKGCS